jgi:hypothetical protein
MRRTPVQHVAHHGHRLLVWLGGFAAAVILLAGIGIWRLMAGPIELDRLVPYVQQAFERAGGLGITVAGVSIAIDHKTHQLDLRVNDVRLALPNGEKLAKFPEMATSFSLGAMLHGRIEPTRLTIERPVLLLTRDSGGVLSFRLGDTGEAPRDLGVDDPLGILAPLRPNAPWSELREVSIRDATIIVDDHLTGRVWQASRVAATLTRSEDGVDGDLSLAADLGTNAPELHATYRYAAATQRLNVELAVDGLDPTALVPLSPVLAPLAQAHVPVSGTLGVRFNLADNSLEGGRVDVSFGAGRFETPLLAGGAITVARGELHADYAPDKSQIRLEQLVLDLGGGTRLTAEGRLDGLAPQLVSTSAAWSQKLNGALDIDLSHVPAARIPSLWPQGVSPGGRRWVAANITDGMLDEMGVQVGVAIDPSTPQPVTFGAPRGTMRFHDLTVNYLDGLPPAKKVSGTATLDDRRLDFTVGGGVVKGIKATGGTLSITDIGAPVETLTVDVTASGPVQDALEAIDAKPLRYAHEAGIDPSHVTGKVDAQLHFKLPLLADLKLDAIDYGAKANFTGVALSNVAFDRNFTDGNLTLDLSHTSAHVQGGGKFDGSPATIDGNLYFRPTTGSRARYRIGLSLDDAARQRLGWDAGERISGPVAADLVYTVPVSGTQSTVDATVDLSAAHLALPDFGWEKPIRTPGTAKLTVDLDNDIVTRIPQIEVKAPGLDGRFAVGLSPGTGHVERVDIRHLAVADSDASGTVTRRPGGGWRADISCGRLDLRNAIRRTLSSDGPDTAPPLQINARISRLTFGDRHEARAVTAALTRDHGGWQSIAINGSYASGGRLSLILASANGTDGPRNLHFESNDLGSSLTLFGIADNVVGGRLKIDGTVDEIGGHQVLHASVEGTDFSVVRAPALARLLSLASLDGLFGMLSGGGIPFTTLHGSLTYSQGRIMLDPMIGYGGALGVTAHGWLSPGEDRIDIDGTLAPAYMLNGIVSNFPVLGPLLTGGEGHGVFAASFRLTGSNDEPTVAVNPVAALTPGVLRHLFDPIFGTAENPPVQQAQH